MSNMSYCRFRNTLSDLIDCQYNFEDITSQEELEAAKRLVKVCREIAEEIEEEYLQLKETDDD